ncbi:MAG: DUF493 domain-containing protein [Nitrosomonas sp.]|nr:DUF493 domain-containing protein [Nitrosomonas sp.]
MTEETSLIEYPCDFPIKIMGKSEKSFAEVVVVIVKQHVPDFDDTTIQTRESKKGAYLSVTCTIRATSRAQLDALYQALSEHPMVAVVL